MKLIAIILLLFFLVACAEELPPNPPAPGEQQLAGQAIGGIPISSSSLPRWAAEIKYTDIDPTQVKSGDTVKVTVTKPASVKTKFYAYSVAYAYNKKFKFWEKVFADTSNSGKIVKSWAENKATFNIPISTDRFMPGPNYVVIYWCIDTEKRDDKGFKIWDCQGNKWQLGAFEMTSTQYPDILIERDIENNRYKSSIKANPPAGTEYTANYESLTGIKTDVSVLQTKNVDDFRKILLTETNIAVFERKWTKRGNVCGFLESVPGKVIFFWFSDANWLKVTTYANTIDDAKVGVYGIKYPSDCDALNKLKLLAAPSTQCGNSVLNAGEECDKESDAACPGVCKPDCTCGIKGPVNTGTCGDILIQKPNAAGVTEDCEPPGVRDPVTGQLISSACFIRDALGRILDTGACDDKCKCIKTAFTTGVCGDNIVAGSEQCDAPGRIGQCPEIQMQDGSCAVPACLTDCKCPVGVPCVERAQIILAPSDIFFIEDLPSNPLNVNEPLGNVIETVVADMWTFLKNGMIDSTKYHQYLRFNTWPNNEFSNLDSHSGSVVSGKDERDVQGNFLFFKDGDVMFEFEIDFEEGLSSNLVGGRLVDLEGKSISLFKESYTISEAKANPSGEIKIMLDGPSKIMLGDSNFNDALFTAGSADVDNEQIEDAEVRMRGAMLSDGKFELSDIRYRLKADAKLGDVYIPIGESLRQQLDEPEGLLGAWDLFFNGVQDVTAKVSLGPEKILPVAPPVEPPVFTQECFDTDGGWNLLAKGLVTMTGALRCTDRCATSQELTNSGGVDQLFECFCGNKVGSGGGQGSGWTSCPEGTSCSNGACIPSTMSSSMDAIVVDGTSGCTAGVGAGCYRYLTGTVLSEACGGCLNACCITYSCTASGGLIRSRSPAGCTGQITGGFATGQAIFKDEVSDVVQTKGIQIALFLIAAMGILAITLLNFARKEQ